MMTRFAIPSTLRLPALVLAALLLALSPAAAQEVPEEDTQEEGTSGEENALPEEARTLIQEMLARLSESMAGLVEILPRYGMPRINEDGDIVIPRLDETPEDRPESAPKGNGTNETEDTQGAREI
ncbi:hypothetical protein [Fodinicurvata fenggangensis]|uniref:hypothetical protein n=1 Tax=Fodinicurvata fenggangensis TaxID=1121830 RepID=UPI00047CA89B|nr:hypothetical protein [Fodinicurvata fenggangensis]